MFKMFEGVVMRQEIIITESDKLLWELFKHDYREHLKRNGKGSSPCEIKVIEDARQYLMTKFGFYDFINEK